MFSFFLQRPYLHMLVAMACGIALGQRFTPPVELLAQDQLLIWVCILSLGLVWWLWRGDPTWKLYLPGFAAVVLIGFFSAALAIRLPLAAPLRHYVRFEPVELTGRVASIPKHQRGHLRFMLDVTAVDGTGQEDGGSLGTCYCFVKCDAGTPLYMTDRVALQAALEEAGPAQNHGQFDYRAYLLQRGTVLTAYAGDASALRRITGAAPWPWGLFSRMRLKLMHNLMRRLPADYGQLAVSVVYGDKITDLPPSIEERFRRAGLTHILVASGTQVSLLILLLASLFCRVYTDFSWRSLMLNAGQFGLTLFVVLAYAALTGFETSIARALVMGTLVLVGRLFHREADGLTSLAQSGLILLVINPLALSSSGFLLSFGATFGLIYAAGVVFPLITPWPRLARHGAQTLATTGGAQLFVAPVLAYSFQQLSLWGLLSNLVAIPTSFALLIAGGVCSMGLSALPVIGIAGSWMVHGLCFALDWEARLFAAWPGSNLAIPQPPWWWIAAYYAMLLLLGERAKRQGALGLWPQRGWSILVVILPVLLCAGVLQWQLIPRPELSALALPNGEAYLWRPYTGGTYLIARSAGLERSHNADTVNSAIRYRGVNRLSGVIWLDAPPAEYPFPDYPATSLMAGGALPTGCDMVWLADGTAAVGARFGLGASEAWLFWSDPGAWGGGTAEAINGIGNTGRAKLILAGPGVSPAGMTRLGQSGVRCVAVGLRRKTPAGSVPDAARTEISITPMADGLMLSVYRPAFAD